MFGQKKPVQSYLLPGLHKVTCYQDYTKLPATRTIQSYLLPGIYKVTCYQDCTKLSVTRTIQSYLLPGLYKVICYQVYTKLPVPRTIQSYLLSGLYKATCYQVYTKLPVTRTIYICLLSSFVQYDRVKMLLFSVFVTEFFVFISILIYFVRLNSSFQIAVSLQVILIEKFCTINELLQSDP